MFVDDDDFYKDDDDENEYKKQKKESRKKNSSDDNNNDDYDGYNVDDDYDYYSNDKSDSMSGSVIGLAKEFIDDSTRELVNGKIKEAFSDMVDSIDAPKLGKSIVLGSVVGAIVAIALYKILK